MGDNLKIEKIKKLNSGKYAIIMDNNKIITYDEVILKYNLLFHKEIDEELLNNINIDTKYYDVYNKVLKYISTKMRSELEINKYLDKLEVDEIDKKNIIIKLKDIGLINHNNYAVAFISDKMNLSTDGPNKIKNELLKHHIELDTIDRELDKYDEEFIYEKLNKLIIKKIKNNTKYSSYILKQKILNHFLELGYNKEMILAIFHDNYKENNNIIEKEYKIIYNKLSKKYEGKELDYKICNKLYQKGFLKEEIDKIKNGF